MFRYAPMICRNCGSMIQPLQAEVDRPQTATSYQDCNYRCTNESCLVAFTNSSAESQRTMIRHQFHLNVPEEVRDGLEETLANALNIRNRPTKLLKFAFETSEDALTWTVFRYLRERGLIGEALGLGNFQPQGIWFWGSRWPLAEDDSLRPDLTSILLSRFQGKPASLTEPDFIAEDQNQLVFVEVKYGASNDFKPDYRGFPQFLGDADDTFVHPPAQVSASGYYELVRNWVTGCALAAKRDREFTFINLAGEACRPAANAFAASLRQSDRRKFRFLAWREMLNLIVRPVEPWFGDYLSKRFPGLTEK